MIFRWNLAAYVCVSSALLVVLGITTWGAYVDFHDVRLTLLQGETNRLRSHAVRTVARIQDQMRTTSSLSGALADGEWLRTYWDRWIPSDETRVFAAVVDNSGHILMHSNRTLEGGQLGAGWYDHALSDVDDDGPDPENSAGDGADNDPLPRVVETHNAALAGGKAAIDVMVPILHSGQEIGTYHSGLDHAWFDKVLGEKISSTRSRWIGIFGLMLVVVVVAGVSLGQIVRRTMVLREAIEMSRVRQFAELGELAAGIAHEIRNPINAIRLNLHSLQRMQRQGIGGDGATESLIGETNREIERVEGLMRIMLGYARPEKPNNEILDLRGELEGGVNFLRPVMDRDRIEMQLVLPPSSLYVHFDRNRFRQILMNLLNNAKDAVGPDGRITIQLQRRREWVEVSVADNGPGVPPSERERIFDPFYSTKELGTGLGLALVKRFVDEGGGHVICETNEGQGARFRISLPEASPEPAGPRED